ncbi:MAG: SemiSWEET transporter [Afipia sp.]|nr:SemiSWEET transporter [Afipia sp.]
MKDSIPAAIHLIGAAGAVLTTICWLPQAVRVVRTKDTHAISLATNLIFATGILLWLIYGIAIGNWPLIVANAISMIFTLVIILMKLRHG